MRKTTYQKLDTLARRTELGRVGRGYHRPVIDISGYAQKVGLGADERDYL